MRPSLRRLRLGLTAWYVGLLAFTLLASYLLLLPFLSSSLQNQTDQELQARAQLAAREAPSKAIDRSTVQPRKRDKESDHDRDRADLVELGSFYVVADRDGTLLADPSGLADGGVVDTASLRDAIDRQTSLFSTTTSPDGELVRHYTVPITWGGQPAAIQAGKSLALAQSTLLHLLLVLAAVGAGALLVAAGGGYFLATRAMGPVESAFDRQRNFVADASHELRTPVSLVRASAEMALRHPRQTVEENRELLEDIVANADLLGTLVGDLTVLARMDDERQPSVRGPVAVSALVADLARQAQTLVAGTDLTLTVEPGPEATVKADSPRLRQVLLILIDNAVKYNRPGGRIDLGWSVERGRVLLTVTDTGQGMAPAEARRATERFYRADSARARGIPGSGLGLAIATAIARAHGGELVLSSEAGRGTRATLSLPQA